MSRRGSARGRRPSPAALLLPPAGSLRVFLVNFCLIFAALAVLGTGSLYYADKATRQRIAAQLRYEERIVVDAMLRRVRETLFTVTADLVYLRKRAERQVQSGQPVEALSDDWQDFAGSHRAYFQLRYLDAAGRERLRVQDGETGPILVAPEDLQDKSATSYMQAAALLRPPEILVTRLDANREFGRIQLPVQPVIRFLAPVMAADGSRAGSVAVNYRAALLLSSVQAIGAAGPGTPFLASDRGRAALADYTSGEAEAIARDGALQNQFAAAYPAAWAAMQDRESGSMADGAGGWVTYSRFTVSSLQPPAAFEDATRWRVASDLTGSEVPAGWFIGSRIDAATLERLLAPAESRTASVLSLFATKS